MDGDLDVPTLDHGVSWLIPSQLLIPTPHASHPGLICSQNHLYCREPRARGWSPRLPCLLPSISFSRRHCNKIREWGQGKPGYFPAPCQPQKCLWQLLSFFFDSGFHWTSPSSFQLPLSSTNSVFPTTLHSKLLMSSWFQLTSGLVA